MIKINLEFNKQTTTKDGGGRVTFDYGLNDLPAVLELLGRAHVGQTYFVAHFYLGNDPAAKAAELALLVDQENKIDPCEYDEYRNHEGDIDDSEPK